MQPTVKLDLDQWSYHEFNKFMASAVGKEDANIKFDLADKILVSWSYETPIEEGIFALPNLEESLLVVAAIFNKINDFVEVVDTEGVDLDLTKWNLKRYQDFNTARQEGSHLRVEKMMHEVAKLTGTDPEVPLTALQGSRMMRAVSDAITKAIQGKN